MSRQELANATILLIEGGDGRLLHCLDESKEVSFLDDRAKGFLRRVFHYVSWSWVRLPESVANMEVAASVTP